MTGLARPLSMIFVSYDRELLERLIKCDDEHGLLPRGDRDKLQKILERTLK